MQRQILPKHIALVLGLVMLATLILVAVVRYSGVDIRYADSPSQQVRLLRFADMDNGDIGVINAQDGSELARFSGEQGFMRGALRARGSTRFWRPQPSEQEEIVDNISESSIQKATSQYFLTSHQPPATSLTHARLLRRHRDRQRGRWRHPCWSALPIRQACPCSGTRWCDATG